ncbi:MAG: PA14 domain-containing protein [Chloroflexota bacterium]|nr:PA14 domain-containing protein [Chloroflexota bacterium]
MFLTHLRERLRKVIVNGQGLAEYALLLGLIGIAIVGIVFVLGRATENTFTGLSCQLQPGGVCNSSVASLYDPSLNGGNWLTPLPTITPCPAGVTCGPTGGGGGGGGGSGGGGGGGGSGGTVATATPNGSGGGTGGGGTVATATPNGGGSTVATNTPAVPTVVVPTTAPLPAVYRAININGASLSIDGVTWEAGTSAPNLSSNGSNFCNQSVTLNPATDANRATMIRCSTWSNSLAVRVTSVPNATYSVYAHFWEDNTNESFNILLNGTTVQTNYASGSAGTWRRLGPWTVTVTNGTIELTTSGGAANLSGIEILNGGSGGGTGGTGGTVVVDGVTYTTGSLLRAVYTGISGTNISDLTSNARYPGSPNECTNPTRFEAPTDSADNYGQRMFGYLLPTVTGSYTFSIAGDDSVELWLSTTASRANATRIAFHTSWTNSREWTKFASQTSTSITLTAGRAYYIEALMKEGGGGDNLAVAWQTPADSTRTVIPGTNLSGTGLTCSSGSVVAVPTATPVPATATPIPPTATPAPTAIPSIPNTQAQRLEVEGNNGNSGMTFNSEYDPDDASNGQITNNVQNNAWLQFNNIDLRGGILQVRARATTPNATTIQFRTGSATGTVFCTINFNGNAGSDWATWTTQGAGCSGTPTGIRTIFVTFSFPSGVGINANWLEIYTQPATYTTGSLAVQRWDNMTGTTMASFTGDSRFTSNTPDSCAVTAFSGGLQTASSSSNNGDNYGLRIAGFLIPTTTGSYEFRISNNDFGQVFLNTSGTNSNNHTSPTSLVNSTSATNFTSWTSASGAVTLNANQAYYFEARMKENTNNDWLRVQWRLNGGSWVLIPGANLSASNLWFNCP